MGVLHDPDLERLLTTLHARSDEQLAAMRDFYAQHAPEPQPLSNEEVAQLKTFRSDKLVALDRDKAEFCYLLCRANNARRIVEAGTSYGVSTLYLAAAVRDNVRAVGGEGVVIGTEYEPEKTRIARAHFEEADLSHFIDLREGDLRETLKHIDGPVDFMLMDIWTDMPAASAGVDRPASQARRDRGLRQHGATPSRLCKLLRVPQRSCQWIPDNDAAIRWRFGNIGARPPLVTPLAIDFLGVRQRRARC